MNETKLDIVFVNGSSLDIHVSGVMVEGNVLRYTVQEGNRIGTTVVPLTQVLSATWKRVR